MLLRQTKLPQVPKAFMSPELCVQKPGALTQYVDRTNSSPNAGCSTFDYGTEIFVAYGSAAGAPAGANE